MKNTLLAFLVFSYSIISSNLIAQQAYKFKDGLYANIAMLINNSPIPLNWIETDAELSDSKFFEKITRAEKIVFFDHNGVRTTIATDSVWGYCWKEDLFINVGGVFHRIDFLGRFSHFVASETTYTPITYRRSPFFGEIGYNKPEVITAEHKEYLVDLLENKIWDFNLKGLELVLKNDPKLWEEYCAFRKAKKKHMKYIFLKRYNEKYPLEIPVR
jgi:hypothetical protein